ncbi:MAG: 6-carboxyhexanoate--CoA ligase, partial [Nitrospirae bacterium]|nr:6-carboxyhexanoate--CoA ligase [Nitrospirota bacterium]
MSRDRNYSVRMRASRLGIHISGAEGIYVNEDVIRMVQKYSERAFTHEKGRADEIHITVEELKKKPKTISSLSLCTLDTKNPASAKKSAIEILTRVGITDRAVEEAFKALNIGISMRGAMLMGIEGVRLEPDLLRGVRVTRMGLTKKSAGILSSKLSKLNLNNDTVKEALILSSKVNNHPMVIGELCISDDPGYTTGYIATRRYGYIRLPHIKKRGIPYGGRAFFITGGEI